MAATKEDSVPGAELGESFFFEHGLPFLSEHYAEYAARAAAGVLGQGSEAMGFDDELSRDHSWEPRFNLILTQGDYDEVGEEMERRLRASLPSSYMGFRVYLPKGDIGTTRIEGIDDFFLKHAGRSRPPKDDLGWVKLSDHRLFQATCGKVFYDPLGEFTRRRKAFAYYPFKAWMKKLSAYLWLYQNYTYNVRRCLTRADLVAAEMYLGHSMYAGMRICYLLNRTYSPYLKWMVRRLRELPYLTGGLLPLLKEMSVPRPWDERAKALDSLDGIVEESVLNEMGWRKPRHHPRFPFYELSGRINDRLPGELRRIQPYEIESAEM